MQKLEALADTRATLDSAVRVRAQLEDQALATGGPVRARDMSRERDRMVGPVAGLQGLWQEGSVVARVARVCGTDHGPRVARTSSMDLDGQGGRAWGHPCLGLARGACLGSPVPGVTRAWGWRLWHASLTPCPSRLLGPSIHPPAKPLHPSPC